MTETDFATAMRVTSLGNHRVPENWEENEDQQKLDDLLQWEKVYEWTKKNERAPFLNKTLYSHAIAIGRSNNQLVCPLACYLNEKWPVRGDWEIGSFGDAMRFSDEEPSYTDHFNLPDWAENAMRKVDEIKSDQTVGNGQAWISQEAFLKILEEVKP